MPGDIHDGIIKRLRLISHNPRPGGYKKLRGYEAYVPFARWRLPDSIYGRRWQ